MPEAWAYLRVSTAKVEQELSLEEQQRWAESYASKQGAELIIFEEKASAKSVLGRKVLQSLFSRLEELSPSRRPKMLLITSLDRLSRDMTDTLVAMRALKKLGIELHVQGQGIVKADTFSERAALVGQSMGGEAENENRSKRMKASWDRRRREGKPTSNKVPYGLSLISERDTPLPDSGPWVRSAFQWYAKGLGAPAIAEKLKAGAPPHIIGRMRADGTPYTRIRKPVWEYNRVLKMLRQRRYRGTIVSVELFDRVQRLLASRPRRQQRRRFEYPLSGAVRCKYCSRTLHGHSTGGATTKKKADGTVAKYYGARVRYYHCIVCIYHVNADRLEAAFRGKLGALRADDRELRRWINSSSPVTDTKASKGEIAALERRANPETYEKLRLRTWETFYGGSITASQLRIQLDKLDEQRDADIAVLQRLKSEIQLQATSKRTLGLAKSLLANFWKLFDKAEYSQKRRLVGELVTALGGCTVNKAGLLRWNGSR